MFGFGNPKLRSMFFSPSSLRDQPRSEDIKRATETADLGHLFITSSFHLNFIYDHLYISLA
jgi:hypothetical protein